MNVSSKRKEINVKLRKDHVNAIKIIGKKITDCAGIELELLKLSEDFHLSKLHHCWFGINGNNKERS